jgi:uncharacterized metal-binding protein YceD (DUF177 family)
MAQSGHPSRKAWSVPVTVADIPDTGSHYELVADQSEREAIARLAGLRTLAHLEAVFDVNQRGDGVVVKGDVKAQVGQTCVVTLEPIENEVHETVDLLFAPPVEPVAEDDGSVKRTRKRGDPPEPLTQGIIDLGAIATEFLILGLDPYPRKPGAEFAQASIGEDKANPFAALAALKKPS